jgi:hypothetical protein
MPRTLRMIFLVIGLALVCVSLAALVYALAPIDTLSQQATLVPTLLVPPGAAP